MTDIETKTNSEQVISELQNIQSVMEETNEIISSGNAANAESFSALGEAVENTSASYATISETATLASETLTELGSVTEGMIEQITLFNSVLDSMNEKLTLGITNILALNEASTANTTIMAANMAQSLLSTAALVTYNATVAQAKLTTDTYSQSILANTLNLGLNMLAVTLYSALITFANGLLLSYNGALNAGTLAISGNTTALGENTAKLSENYVATSNNNAATDYSNTTTAENTDKINAWNIVGAFMTGIKESLTFYNALNNALDSKSIIITAAKLVKDKLAERQSRKQAAANTVEATTRAAAESAKAGWLAPVVAGLIIGAATLAVGVLSGISSVAAMATGGVVSSPTVALVGEGRYPEAVVPLGSSPQFANMKAEIAAAVVQGIAALGGGRGKSGGNVEVVLNIDGDKFARAILPAMEKEYRRKGRSTATIRSV